MNPEVINDRANALMMNVLPLSIRTRFEFIKRNFGHTAYKTYQYYEKITIKLEHLYSDINYLNQCRWNNLMPKFLKFKVSNPMLLYSKAYEKCQHIFLKEEINFKKKSIKYLSMERRNTYDELANIFPPVILTKINQIINKIQSQENDAKYWTHYKKFWTLFNISEQQQQRQQQRKNRNHTALNTSSINEMINTTSNNEEEKQKIVWNLSSRNLTEEELAVLEKGLSYNRPSVPDRSKIISNVEYLFHHASSIQKELVDFKKWDEDPDNISNKEVRVLEPRQLSLAADLKNATERFFYHAEKSIKTRRHKDFNANNDHKILLSLSRDPSILITKPDKGRGVVLLDRNNYIEKLDQMLSDTTKFKLLDHDPTISRENILTSLLLLLKKDEYLTQQEYKYIKPVGSIPARLYGLPKVHKDNVDETTVVFRPIVSCIQSYNYRLGKFLANIIKPIRDGTYSLKNNNQFLKFLKENSDLFEKNKMLSFDIVSLFTNIPVNETIEIICNKLYCTDPKLRPFIPEDYFRKLLSFATTGTHFLFNKKYYDQSDGVSMGTPLAAIFAEIFMTHFEEKYISNLLNANEPKLLTWRRYVDDTFTICKNNADKDEIVQLLNTFHPCIKFTVEPETDNAIPFLDVLVIRHEKGFDTTVYRKKTATKLMLKWDSLVPKAYKTASVTPFVNRAIRICSKYDLLHDEFKKIREMAQFNGYPSNFVEQIIYKKLDKLYQFNDTNNQIQQIPDQNKKYKYIEIPYIGRPSYAFAKKLKSIITKNDPTSDLRVIYQTTNPTKRYFPSKDPLNINQKSGVVYQINCNDCNKTYIGKTIRQVYRRLCEHKKDVTKATLSIQKYISHTQPINKINRENTKILNGRIVKKTSTQTLRRSPRLINKQAHSHSQTKQKQKDILSYKPNSALGKHVKHTSHSIDFQNPLILNQDQKNYRLLIKESIDIRSRKPILNGTDTSVPLYVFPEGYQKSSYQISQP